MEEGVDVEGFENVVDADPVAVRDDIAEIHRTAVGQDQIDFRVRHAEGFDHILN